MTTIIGIDPGSRKTGYALITQRSGKWACLDYGHLDLRADTLAERLQAIAAGIQSLVIQYQPTEAAVEQIFMHTNAQSALKLGHARGAALVALNMPVSEYSARMVKQTITGYGAASKEQVQQMLRYHLHLPTSKLQADAADAVAVALCHAYSRDLTLRLAALKRTTAL